MSLSISITKRHRRRQLKSGVIVVQARYVVSYSEPSSGRRKQFFFKRYREAAAKRNALQAGIVALGSNSGPMTDLTVAEAVKRWLDNRRSEVKPGTWRSYRQAAGYIIGPLLAGTKHERHLFASKGKKREDAQFVAMLGAVRLSELTTAEIRNWHKTLTSHVSGYTANVAKKFLRAALALAAEDLHLRVPPMPSQLGRGRIKTRKSILTPEQVGRLLRAALADERKGLYYAFPFLTGVRPSEQLALLWEDVDLAAGVIHIRRMQEQDGTITQFTKTAAGMRDIPLSAPLRYMLLRWQQVCPEKPGTEHRVFPRLGRTLPAGRQEDGGGSLSYANFRLSYWRPAFAALGLPYVTPHSARHSFISALQAEGIEVGLVAKLAGHANAMVTLSHYTQAVRGGEAAMKALEKAFGHGVAPQGRAQ